MQDVVYGRIIIVMRRTSVEPKRLEVWKRRAEVKVRRYRCIHYCFAHFVAEEVQMKILEFIEAVDC